MSHEKSIFLSEEEKLKIRLNRSPTEHFRMLMQLIRISQKIQKAKIIDTKS